MTMVSSSASYILVHQRGTEIDTRKRYADGLTIGITTAILGFVAVL
jgi:hypothetical protein